MKFNNIVSVPGLDGIIVGITNSLLGCSCEQHVVSGEEVRIGSVISFAPDRVLIEGVEEYVENIWKIR